MSRVTIKHERTSLYVEIQIDTGTYLLDQEQYAELYRTMLQHPPKNVEENERADWEDALEDVLFGFAKMRKEHNDNQV